MIAYDPKCEELAAHFLGEGAERLTVQDLAQHIQRAIEEWFQGTGHATER